MHENACMSQTIYDLTIAAKAQGQLLRQTCKLNKKLALIIQDRDGRIKELNLKIKLDGQHSILVDEEMARLRAKLEAFAMKTVHSKDVLVGTELVILKNT
jgi:hypothetical protein